MTSLQSSKEFVTLLKTPSSVPRRYSPSGLPPPVMSEQQQPQQPAESKRSDSNQLSPHDSSATFVSPPINALPWMVHRYVPNKDFGNALARETQSKSSRFFLTPFLTKNLHDCHTEAQSKGKLSEAATCRRLASRFRHLGDRPLRRGDFGKSAPLELHPTYTFVGVNFADRYQQYIHTRARIGCLCSSSSVDDVRIIREPGASSMMLILDSLTPALTSKFSSPNLLIEN